MKIKKKIKNKILKNKVKINKKGPIKQIQYYQ